MPPILIERLIGAAEPPAETGVFGELATVLLKVMLDIVDDMPVLIAAELGKEALELERLFACPTDEVVEAVFRRLKGGGTTSGECGEYGEPARRALLPLRFELELDEVELLRACRLRWTSEPADEEVAIVLAPVLLMPYIRPEGGPLGVPAEAEIVRGLPAGPG